MTIFFEDGPLRYPPDIYPNQYVKVDASEGVSSNTRTLEYLLHHEKFCGEDVVIYTNSLVALDGKYNWNDEWHFHDLYIRCKYEGEFTLIRHLTTRELKQGHNIAKLYLNNEFSNLPSR